MAEELLAPVHPGEILLLEFLEPMGLSQYALAKAIGVPPQRIGEIVHGRRAVTAETALRLGRYFAMDARFWLNLQTRYDLDVAEDALADRLDREVTPRAA
jgi:addiction module HigA family antidote